MPILPILAFLLLSSLSVAGPAHGQEPWPAEQGYRISGKIRFSKAGDLFVALVAADEWRKNRDFNHQMVVAWKDRKGTENEAEFEFLGVAPGDYALKVFQDSNSNGKLDFLFGPTEPWGFYRPYRLAWRPPSFKEVCFPVRENLTGIIVDIQTSSQ